MQFAVPQFLDEEDKIFGPLSLKQFGFIFVPGLIILAIFRIFGIGIIFFTLSLPVGLAGIGIAFGMFNGKHVYDLGPVLFSYLRAPKMMIFHKIDNDDSLVTIKPVEAVASNPNADFEESQSKLRKLSLLLDQKNQEEYDLLNSKR
jgi:hypothetical protein